MKRLMIIVACMTFYTAFADKEKDKAERFNQIRLLLEQMMVKDDSNAPNRLNQAMQTYRAWTKYPEFAELSETVAKNWREILDNLEEVAPSETHKAIIVLTSVFSLPLRESHHCLNKIADLCLDKIIGNELFLWAVIKHEEKTEQKHRLLQNTKDPVVAEILRKAKAIDPENEYYIRKAPGRPQKNMPTGKVETPPATVIDGTQLTSVAGKKPDSVVPKVKPPQPAPVENKTAPWKRPLFLGTLIIIATAVAWYYLKKKSGK